MLSRDTVEPDGSHFSWVSGMREPVCDLAHLTTAVNERARKRETRRRRRRSGMSLERALVLWSFLRNIKDQGQISGRTCETLTSVVKVKRPIAQMKDNISRQILCALVIGVWDNGIFSCTLVERESINQLTCTSTCSLLEVGKKRNAATMASLNEWVWRKRGKIVG